MSGLYPLTCLTWVALPGDKSPASIAVRVIETHKPPNRDKVAPPGEKNTQSKCKITQNNIHLKRVHWVLGIIKKGGGNERKNNNKKQKQNKTTHTHTQKPTKSKAKQTKTTSKQKVKRDTEGGRKNRREGVKHRERESARARARERERE